MPRSIVVGNVYEGIVTRIKPYGLFVEVDGVPGLIRIPEISLEPIEDIFKVAEIGKRVRFQVLNLNDPVQRPHEQFNGSMKILLYRQNGETEV
ncbi:MAG: S1 RNA-binding domain-containing protein [Cyanobacteria bacterium J06626_4]